MKKLALVVGALAFPLVSFADACQLTNLEGMATSVGVIINTLLPVMFALGLLVFFWGLVRYIFGKEDDKAQAKKTMIWGVIAIFIMASIWGLVAFLQGTFGVGTETTQVVPGITI